MLPFLTDKWGNASSRDHAYGWDANEAVEEARFEVAELIHAEAREIFFTGGATESLTLALRGLFPSAPSAKPTDGPGLLTTKVEHEAVLAACRHLEAQGTRVSRLPVDRAGNLDAQRFTEALERERPKAACLIAAHNETGVVLPFRELAAAARARGVLTILDAAQALGRIPLDARADGFDLAAFSAHKLHGPKGVGALFVRGGRDEIPLEPLIPGGGQEQGLRGGTLDVPAIVGFGEACRLARLEMQEETSRIRVLRDRLEKGLMARCPQIAINGDDQARLANTANLRFPGADARTLIRDMHDVAVSTRSACSSGSQEASHVLKAMGLSDADAFASVRFSLGRFTTEAEVDAAVDKAAVSYRKILAAGDPV
jgi:cysteine desulfurase